MKILIDMDGVLADFETPVFEHLASLGGPLREELDHEPFKITDRVGDAWAPEVKNFINKEGFFRNLKPMNGALEAFKAMSEIHQLWICTSPLISNPTCASDKLDWVAEHLGKEWCRRTLITSDKTIVHGDALIDDKAYISGELVPAWTHILYDEANRQSGAPVRMKSWQAWPEALEALERLT